MTDTTVDGAQGAKPGFLTTAALQKAVAFVVLVALLVFFSLFAPNFATGSNMVGIMQATAVNGVLGDSGMKLMDGLMMNQLKAVALTIVWSVVATAIIAYIVKALIGLRPTEEVERQGLDIREHGEEGYVS